MKVKTSRVLSVFISLLMITGLNAMFAGCGNDMPGGTETTAGAESGSISEKTDTAVTTELKEDLPDVNYGGADITFFMRNNDYYVSDMYIKSVDEKTSFLDEAVYQRNMAVSEKYGVNIVIVRSTNNNADTDALNIILSGDCTYDVIANHGRTMFTYATKGALIDWYKLEYVDLEKPWWNQGMLDDFTVNGKLFCMSGDMSYQSLGATVCMVFNKTICSKLNLDYPYGDVLDGTWTFDKFSEMALAAKSDLNGNGILSAEEGDIYGYMTRKYCGPMTVIYSGGGSIVKVNDSGELELSLYNERNLNIFTDFFKLADNDNCEVYTNYSNDGFYKTFATQNVLFTDTRLYDISYLINNGMTEYGIIPWPKYDESVDNYYSWVDAVGNTFGVPVGIKDDRLEMISVTMEALAAEGYRSVIPTFYENLLGARYAQDETSNTCLDLIKEGRKYDIASYMAEALNCISTPGYTLITYPDHNFSTWYKGIEKMAGNQLKAVNEMFATQK